MNWRFKCQVCRKEWQECLRIEEVYHKGEMNILHCDKPAKVIPLKK